MSNGPIPFGLQQAVNYFNIQPSDVKGRANEGVEYYRRVFYNKAYAAFVFHLPPHWDLNWFRFWLFHYGSICGVYTNRYGWVCQPYSIKRFDYNYQPSVTLTYNPYISEKEIIGKIGVNAEIIRIFDDFFGIDDIVTRYAVMLAQVDRSININMMNSNVAYVFEADSKKQGDEIREAYGKATEGEPLVVINKNVMKDKTLVPLLPNLKNNYLVLDLLEARRGLINAFLTEIGIKNVSVQKKERLTKAEGNDNNEETKALIEVMKENIAICFKKLNKISGLNLSVNLRFENGGD